MWAFLFQRAEPCKVFLYDALHQIRFDAQTCFRYQQRRRLTTYSPVSLFHIVFYHGFQLVAKGNNALLVAFSCHLYELPRQVHRLIIHAYKFR